MFRSCSKWAAFLLLFSAQAQAANSPIIWGPNGSGGTCAYNLITGACVPSGSSELTAGSATSGFSDSDMLYVDASGNVNSTGATFAPGTSNVYAWGNFVFSGQPAAGDVLCWGAIPSWGGGGIDPIYSSECPSGSGIAFTTGSPSPNSAWVLIGVNLAATLANIVSTFNTLEESGGTVASCSTTGSTVKCQAGTSHAGTSGNSLFQMTSTSSAITQTHVDGSGNIEGGVNASTDLYTLSGSIFAPRSSAGPVYASSNSTGSGFGTATGSGSVDEAIIWSGGNPLVIADYNTGNGTPLVQMNSRLLLVDGSCSSPSVGFTNNGGLGLDRSATYVMDFCANNTSQAQTTANGLRVETFLSVAPQAASATPTCPSTTDFTVAVTSTGIFCECTNGGSWHTIGSNNVVACTF